MEVEIISRKLIAPSSPTPHHRKKVGISCFDQIVSSGYVSCIFYYPTNGREQGAETLVNQLQRSLSETLTLFYPFAGRYTEGSLFVDCNDAGAEFLEARVRAASTLSYLIRGGEFETELRNQLVPGYQPPNSPLVIVQFNMFGCGGVAVGISVYHRIADGFTIFTFIDAWARSCRSGGIDEVKIKPSFELAQLCPPTPAFQQLDLPMENDNDNNKIMKRFVFQGDSILKHKTNYEKTREPSRVQVVSAVIWKAMIMVASQARSNSDCFSSSLLALIFNIRGKTTLLPVQECCCGNFVTPAMAHFTPRQDSDKEVLQLQDFVGRVQDAIANTNMHCAKALTGLELSSLVTNGWKKIGEGAADLCCITSWCGFPIYEADFGWGKPDWVTSIHSTTSNVVLILDAKDGKGIEAWIALDQDSMALFQQNPDIVALTTSQR